MVKNTSIRPYFSGGWHGGVLNPTSAEAPVHSLGYVIVNLWID